MPKKRFKKMTTKEFRPIADRLWVPVVLAGEGRPYWMHNIPEEKVQLVLASGTFIDPTILETEGITISDVIGGMDIYRYDQQDVIEGYPINKDHYSVVLDPASQDALLVMGPYKDHDHWLSELPKLPPEIIIIEG